MTTKIIRSRVDVLALVPVLLGFRPRESLVLLTLKGAPPLNARLDLPEVGADLDGLAEALLAPALKHGVTEVILVVFTRHLAHGQRCIEEVARAFECHGVVVRDALASDSHRWWPLRQDADPGPGTPYDTTTHPFEVEAIVSGRVIHESRESMAAGLDPDEGAVAAVERLIGRRPRRLPGERVAVEASWAGGLLERSLRRGEMPGDAEIARLLPSLRDIRVRDRLWLAQTRETSGDHLEFWRHVTRRAPRDLRAAPASMAGFAAWLGGDGAMAWCAVDLALASAPGYSMALLLADGLQGALPPSAWDDIAAAGPPSLPA